MFKFCNSCDGIYDSLDVRFTKACDNNCAFCIERNGINSLGLTNVEKMIDSTIKSGIKSVLILGGEPFLQPNKLLEYVKGIRAYVNLIYITTSLPNAINDQFITCLEIFELIDGLNVSIHSTDWQKNNEVFKASSNHNRLELLGKLNKVKLAHGNFLSHKIRVSITLCRGGIDSSEKIIDSLDYLSALGCKQVKINELQHSPDLYVSFEDIFYHKKFYKSPYSHGCTTGWIRRDGMKITVKRSCFLTEPSLRASWSDLFKMIISYFRKPTNKFRVMYENGEVKNKWELKQRESKC